MQICILIAFLVNFMKASHYSMLGHNYVFASVSSSYCSVCTGCALIIDDLGAFPDRIFWFSFAWCLSKVTECHTFECFINVFDNCAGVCIFNHWGFDATFFWILKPKQGISPLDQNIKAWTISELIIMEFLSSERCTCCSMCAPKERKKGVNRSQNTQRKENHRRPSCWWLF